MPIVFPVGGGGGAFPENDPEWSNVRFLYQLTGTNIETDGEKTGRTMTHTYTTPPDVMTVETASESPTGYLLKGGRYATLKSDAGAHCELGTDWTVEIGFNGDSSVIGYGDTLVGMGGGSAVNGRFTFGARGDGKMWMGGVGFEDDPVSNGSDVPYFSSIGHYQIGDLSDSKSLHSGTVGQVDHFVAISRDRFISFYMNGYLMHSTRWTCTNNTIGDSNADFGIGSYGDPTGSGVIFRGNLYYTRITAAVRKHGWLADVIPPSAYPLTS